MLAQLDSAAKSTVKKSQAADKLKTSSSSNAAQHAKVESTIAELQEAKKLEEETRAWLAQITASIREKDMAWFGKANGDDFRAAMCTYAKAQLEVDKTVLKELEEAGAALAHMRDNAGVTCTHPSELIAAEVL